MAPNLLPSLMFAVRRRRRRSRLMTWSSASAAAVRAGDRCIRRRCGPFPDVCAPAGERVGAGDVSGRNDRAGLDGLAPARTGDLIDLRCVCLAPVYAHHDKLAMVVVNRDGTHTQLATWVAEPGHTAMPAGSISTPVGQIQRYKWFLPTTAGATRAFAVNRGRTMDSTRWTTRGPSNRKTSGGPDRSRPAPDRCAPAGSIARGWVSARSATCRASTPRH